MQINTKKLHPFIMFFSLFILLGLIAMAAWFFYTLPVRRSTITVTGNSRDKVKNQIATFSINTDAEFDEKQKAVEEVTQKANYIIEAIKKFGIPEEDVQTNNLNVYQQQQPVFDKGVTTYTPGKWHATYSILVTLRDIKNASSFTTLLAGFDGTTMWGPNYQIDNSKLDENVLLKAAYNDARDKALQLAKDSGKKLGETISITEASTNGGIIPMYKQAVGFGGAGDIPILPGSTEVEKSVVVTFRMR